MLFEPAKTEYIVNSSEMDKLYFWRCIPQTITLFKKQK